MWSFALGYALFYCWPYAFRMVGFGQAESMLLVIATINVHHFIVDRYIWRATFINSGVRRPETAALTTPVAAA
jgi:hypothetical protein